ncbi:MAG: tRNA (adenosine(37)-N6)-threonylcarbamoyltransferase complex ATPase subunit type 1 TsaE [bacterium]|nr:tRNA (adenosine(37)-N6)-threonylcarbamoyltransferase complex ATPase subunit type 1 TsaE [bacterium]MDY2830382.1 tRNA (adenosine(37)-N6)-threonylcarbamoyltransferase complex ATPase subunit type 1 TsaE [Alphaproteobacteria bacterium]
MADLTKIFISKSEKDTKKLAETLAQKAKRGDVFALFGTLGMGKSVFARAFIQKLTDAKEVPSPTFTLVQQYEASDFEIYHFDLYRLKSPDEVFELGFEEAVYEGVCLIEWPEQAGNWLPRDIFKIEITSNKNERIFKISAHSSEKAKRLEDL